MFARPLSQALPLSVAAAMLVAILSISSITGCAKPIAPDQEGCRSNRDCPVDHVCRSGTCEARPGCLTNFDCEVDEVCSAITRQCVPGGNPIDEEEEEEEEEDDEDKGGNQNSCQVGNRYCDGGTPSCAMTVSTTRKPTVRTGAASMAIA